MGDQLFADLPTLVKTLVPVLPMIGKTALTHAFGLSSSPWDMRTEIVVKVARATAIKPGWTISEIQQNSLREVPIRNDTWISRYTIPVPEDSIRQALFTVIEQLKPSSDPLQFANPSLEPVTAEWTGSRVGKAGGPSTELGKEQENYKNLMEEITSPTTILYFHGGSYSYLDPSSHRSFVKRFAEHTSGRCLSVRYRLAPQNPFPAALLDALVSYFTLLSPPPGAFHEAVKPEHIILTGDSAGAGLATALLLTLLHMHREKVKISWHGQELEVPLPAGAALISPWMDLTSSLPSCQLNAKYDMLPASFATPEDNKYPRCSIWPVGPPRHIMYADDSLLGHPLVSPLGAAAKWWGGVQKVPVFIVCGWELFTDEDKHTSMVIAKQGGSVVYEEWEFLPHCFPIASVDMDYGKKSLDHIIGFIKSCVQGEKIETKATLFKFQGSEVDLPFSTVSPFTQEDINRKMTERITTIKGKPFL
jgi:acetyl esterase/lipase